MQHSKILILDPLALDPKYRFKHFIDHYLKTNKALKRKNTPIVYNTNSQIDRLKPENYDTIIGYGPAVTPVVHYFADHNRFPKDKTKLKHIIFINPLYYPPMGLLRLLFTDLSQKLTRFDNKFREFARSTRRLNVRLMAIIGTNIRQIPDLYICKFTKILTSNNPDSTIYLIKEGRMNGFLIAPQYISNIITDFLWGP